MLLKAFWWLVLDVFELTKNAARWVSGQVKRHPHWCYLMLVVFLIAWVIWGRIQVGSPVVTWEFWERNPESFRNLVWMLTGAVGAFAGLYGLYLANLRTASLERQSEAQLAQSQALLNQAKLSERSHITERYTKAVEQLGHETPSVRLGALYALERIALDSLRDQRSIIEVVSSFLRHRSQNTEISVGAGEVSVSRPPIDVEAAFRILLNFSENRVEGSAEFDLQGTDLSGVEIYGKKFQGFNFQGSVFRGASFHDCEFKDSDFRSVKFMDCRFYDSSFKEIEFLATDFSDVSFRIVDFSRARFSLSDVARCSFVDCKFANAVIYSGEFDSVHFGSWKNSPIDLSSVKGLSQSDVNSFRYTAGTEIILPEGLILPSPEG